MCNAIGTSIALNNPSELKASTQILFSLLKELVYVKYSISGFCHHDDTRNLIYINL